MEAQGEEGQLKLLGSWRSPFVARVRIALALKGIDYQIIEEDTQNKSQLLLQLNPVHKKIPVLIHNGKIVCESMIIVQYIDETWDTKAQNLMPKHAYDRAIARFWASFVDEKLLPSLLGVLTGQDAEQQNAVEESLANFLLLEEALRTSSCSGSKAYFGGDQISLVDIALGGLLVFMKLVQKITNTVLIDPEKIPLLSAWMDRFSKADGVKQVLPDPAKVYEYLCAKRAKFISEHAGN